MQTDKKDCQVGGVGGKTVASCGKKQKLDHMTKCDT